ncbi:lysylphosphatidylglycerol synthase domain-containing protein [Qipengyuania sphaerica]|uniref:lysylphosphatidylglycerol synthase domain-containing protein n=1 Tax=Qipengyuania sphaerica TaxID=2867243 RepID=UPI001C867B64|nr:lysylphosphatidylglycerol synthase domain-containing protein [Qipengyuania sphaerica]MBX7539666.1 lysylphosphatidylglycerol synthase domain-containing protein [Qipengyuania sphaerica]
MDIRRIAFRTAAALLISGLLLALLVRVADIEWRDFAEVSPGGFALVLAFHLLLLVTRGILMSQLARCGEGHLASHRAWIRLAARHQFLFTILPTGLGDLLFPALARRLVGHSAASGFAVIVQMRARDLIVLPAFALAGGLWISGLEWLGVAVALTAAPALFFADKLFRIALEILRKPLPEGRIAGFLETAAGPGPAGPPERLRLAATSLLIWILATCAVLAAFSAIDEPVSVGVAVLFLAGINFFGALALSIGGLGVAEAGGAAALVLANRGVKSASALALVVRPMLLVSMLAASLLVDFVLTIDKRFGSRI